MYCTEFTNKRITYPIAVLTLFLMITGGCGSPESSSTTEEIETVTSSEPSGDQSSEKPDQGERPRTNNADMEDLCEMRGKVYDKTTGTCIDRPNLRSKTQEHRREFAQLRENI